MADLAFVIHATRQAEAELLVQEVQGPLTLASGLPNNLTAISIDELTRLGAGRIGLPTVAVHAAIHAFAQTLRHVREGGHFAGIIETKLLCSADELKAASTT